MTPDAYALVTADGAFVGIWREQELAEKLKDRSIMSKGERVVPMFFRRPVDVAALKDAERYRWWRKRFSGDDASLEEVNTAFRNGADTENEVDAAIDAAMREAQ